MPILLLKLFWKYSLIKMFVLLWLLTFKVIRPVSLVSCGIIRWHTWLFLFEGHEMNHCVGPCLFSMAKVALTQSGEKWNFSTKQCCQHIFSHKCYIRNYMFTGTLQASQGYIVRPFLKKKIHIHKKTFFIYLKIFSQIAFT